MNRFGTSFAILSVCVLCGSQPASATTYDVYSVTQCYYDASQYFNNANSLKCNNSPSCGVFCPVTLLDVTNSVRNATNMVSLTIDTYHSSATTYSAKVCTKDYDSATYYCTDPKTASAGYSNISFNSTDLSPVTGCGSRWWSVWISVTLPYYYDEMLDYNVGWN